MNTLALRNAVSRVTIAILMATGALAQEDHAHGHDAAVAHTHVGINPTWRPADWSHPGEGAVDMDPTDNNKLWLFSMPPTHAAATPGWPHWQQGNGSTFLVLTPVLEEGHPIAKPSDPNKVLFTCDFLYSKEEGYGDPHGAEHLDGWSSAFGPQGAWNLQGIDAKTVPAWDICVRRERISTNLEEDDFFALRPDDTPAMQKNGDLYPLEKRYLAEEGAWGIHDHMGFYFWLDEHDEEVYIVLSAHDAGGMYQRSADFTIRFARTVIQPVPGDLNGDGVVDLHDLEILVDNWGRSGIYHGDEHEAHDHDHDHHDHED